MLIRWPALGVVLFCLNLRCTAQWIAGGYIGEAHTLNSGLTVRQPALATEIRFPDISYRGESFQTPLYYGVRGGYFFRRHWAAEIEFTHLKVFANVDQSAAVTGTLNGVPINARVPINAIVQSFSICARVRESAFRRGSYHSTCRIDGSRDAQMSTIRSAIRRFSFPGI